jgi:phospholipid/cholesterol/gamma-HCH transport system substrate-binding protein
VTYRGTEVGLVDSVDLTDTGVTAVLSLKSDVSIPADLQAEVHSQTAIGEQYVALLPRGAAQPLKNGDVIPLNRTTVPPDINALISATNRGLQAIPRENLKTVIDESFTAVGGLGPELSRIVKGSTQLAIDARDNLDSMVSLIDQSGPLLDSQTETSDSVSAWASNLANITGQLKDQDPALAGFIDKGSQTSDQVRQLIERVQPTLPVVLANLVSVGQVAVTYQPAVEQLLVLLPQAVQMVQGPLVMGADTKQPYAGFNLDFNLNLNLPPACTTGFLPAQQRRTPAEVDNPARPPGDLYCRVPQDSPFNVRGARNYPCLTVPGKRAPTVKMCESDENYVPLNDGYNWKGDPNATSTGQDIPQLPPGAPPAAAPAAQAPPPVPALATAEYDPATGTYAGPDGRVYTQADLAQTPKEKSWQAMLIPATP